MKNGTTPPLRKPGMLYATHQEAEGAIQTLLACLPEVLSSIMVDEHTRWLDGAKGPLPPEQFDGVFRARLQELFERRGGTVRLPNVSLTREEIGLAIDGVAAMVDETHREAAPLLRKLQEAYTHGGAS